MSEEKDLLFRNQPAKKTEETSHTARARNKTVMLSAEMTGQVRQMLGPDNGQTVAPSRQPTEGAMPAPFDWGGLRGGGNGDGAEASQDGFMRPRGTLGGFSAVEPLVEEPVVSKPIPNSFDPLTSIAPSVTFGGMAGIANSMSTETKIPPRSNPTTEMSRAAVDSAIKQESASGSFQIPSFVRPNPSAQVLPPLQTQVSSLPKADSRNFMSAPFSSAPIIEEPKEERARAATADMKIDRVETLQPSSWHTVVSKSSETGKLVGLLVSYDRVESGEIFEIRAGRFIITSQVSANGDYLLIDDETISPLHAIVRVSKEGNVQVLDQLSEYGTGIIRVGAEVEEEISGALANLSNGDILRFGKRNFVFVSIPTMPKKKGE
jgi:hypothetical protein